MNKNIKNDVKKILEVNPGARKSDMELIIQIADKYLPVNGLSFRNGCEQLESLGISFESITRARRKVQQLYPYLKDKETENVRSKEEENYCLEYGRKF